MNHWMVMDTIQHDNLWILVAHPPGPRSKDVVLEFLGNFTQFKGESTSEASINHHVEDSSSSFEVWNGLLVYERTCKDWIKDFATEAYIKKLGGSVYLHVQAKWLGRKASSKLCYSAHA